MGPRSFRPRNEVASWIAQQALLGFNGAAVFKTAESENHEAWDALYSGFNGAAVFQTAELAVRLGNQYVKTDASMGPRSFRPRNDASQDAIETKANLASMGPRSVRPRNE